MPHYFYTDANGQKQGPIDDQTLRILASQKRILPSTPLETTGGHQGTAGQIPSLFKAAPVVPVARQLFCTNCGSPGPEQAPGCMACGMPPIGHNRFCRQCGTGLHPGQAVCTKCGMPLMAAPVPGPVPIYPPGHSVESATDKVTGAILSIILLLLVLGALVGLGWFLIYKVPEWLDDGSSGDRPRKEIANPLQKAKEGDWGRFSAKAELVDVDNDEMSILLQSDIIKVEVDSIDDGKVKLRLSCTGGGPLKDLERADIGTINRRDELDVTLDPKSSTMDFVLSKLKTHLEEEDGGSVRIEKGQMSKDTLEVDDKTIKCDVATFTFTKRDDDGDVEYKAAIKEWTSPSIPGVPFVKVEVEFKEEGDEAVIKITIMLTDYGSGDD